MQWCIYPKEDNSTIQIQLSLSRLPAGFRCWESSLILMREFALETTHGLGAVFGKFAGLARCGISSAALLKGLSFGRGVKEYFAGNMVAANSMILLQTASERKMSVRGYAAKNVGGISDWV
jgi:hypothetical protein